MAAFGGATVLAVVQACAPAEHRTDSQNADWSDYLGGPESSQYSALDQINLGNVGKIKEIWRYSFPDNARSHGNPLVIGGKMFVPSSRGVTALDSRTGRELWHHDMPGTLMRGLSAWRDKGGRLRIFFNANDRLHAIDAETGAGITTFGDKGSVDLKVGLDRDPETIKRIETQTPPRIFNNLLIVGSTGGDDWDAPPGYIRAYDAATGKLVWKFHTIPHPGEPFYEDWPKDAWKTVGGVNAWSELTLDVQAGIVFVPLGSAKYNFYGANRLGNNTYANALVALDARTGRRLWHFQTVHHDLWDYDLPQAPKLLTLKRDGKEVEAVAVATKTGYIFTFDRRTGKPIFPIEERPVPQTDVEGEITAPTQPFPVAPPPFARQKFTAEDLSPYLPPEERKKVAQMVSGLRNEGPFTPPSLSGTVTMPGTAGGTNWGNGAVDPETGRLFIVSIEVPSILKLESGPLQASGPFMHTSGVSGETVYKDNCAACHGENRAGQPPAIPSLEGIALRMDIGAFSDVVYRGRATMPGFSLSDEEHAALSAYLGYKERPKPRGDKPRTQTADPIKYRSGYNFLFSSQGLPANAPPWSNLTAIDMNEGRILWQVPFGQLPKLPNSGSIMPRGTIVTTAGGLVIAANQDRQLRAWSMDTGEVVLEKPLPSSPGGIPAVYMLDGRQYISVPVASYDPKLAAMSGGAMAEGQNSIITYALPTGANR